MPVVTWSRVRANAPSDRHGRRRVRVAAAGVRGHRRPGRRVLGAGRRAVLGHRAAASDQQRGVVGRHNAVRPLGGQGDRTARRTVAGLEDTDRDQERKLFIHRRPAGRVRVARQKR